MASLVFAHDGEDDYAVSKISPVLMKNANAVVRLMEINFEVRSKKEAVGRKHFVITILNENGDRWSAFHDYYDKFREINSVEGFLYDANGKLLKKVKTKELQDLSAVSDISLMDDNRIKLHNFYYKIYPYTIEYDETFTFKTTYFFPTWYPQLGEKVSIEKSSYTFICPLDYQFRYKAYNFKGEPVSSSEKNKKFTTWSVNNLPAVLQEVYSPEWNEITTSVFLAPTDFQMGDYQGNMSSWDSYGQFQYQLNAGRDKLPDDVKLKVHQLTDGVKDTKEKIRILYEFMQKNTRYISIQLGIGGWQPFEASYVAQKSYGDCKALSNYMYSLLKEANIKSCYTIIKSGDGETFLATDFPSDQFDHIILFVPNGKDTTWLECTSQTLPAGYLSGFTANRWALAVDDGQGKLVHTPKYTLQDNLEVRKIKAVLDDEATLKAKVSTSYRAEQQDELHSMIHALSKDKVKEELQSQLDFATYDINSFDYKEEKSELPVIEESLDISVSNYASMTGKRLFIMPNVMTRSNRKLKTDDERKFDIVLYLEYTDIDTVEIELPPGYVMEAIPTPVSIETKFGRYNNSVKMEGNKIYYYRKMEKLSGRYPASDYKALVGFFDAVYKADRNRVVLVKGN
jgi:hypothetical protein